MKKVILGFLVAIMLLATATTYVSAATVSANPTEVKVGDTVTVKVALNSASRMLQFDMTYDAASFDFKDVTCDNTTFTKSVNNAGGKVSAMFYDNTGNDANVANFATVTFTAKANVDAAKFSTEIVEPAAEAATTDVTVKVADPKPADPTPTDPKPADPTPANPNPGTNQGAAPAPATPAPAAPAAAPAPASNGAMPTTLPQTGVPYAVIAVIALAVIASGVVVAKKLSK